MSQRYDSGLSFIWRAPTKIVFGAGSAELEIQSELDELGIERALLVTDTFLAGHEISAKVKAAMGRRLAGVFGEAVPDSGISLIEKGADQARRVNATGVVSIGGGSSIDTAKGIALLLAKGGRLRDYDGINAVGSRIAPHLAIPTTAGTGSEVTYVAVVKDHEAGRKLLFADWNLIPDTALLDPALITGLPAAVTAHTGMDALSHAIEAMHSLQREPIADGAALHAARLIEDNLLRCIQEPGDLTARGCMMIAANLAGAAFGNAQVGLVHAIAHTVGAKFGIPHGLANAIALPHVIRHNASTCPDVYKDVALAMGLVDRNTPDPEAAEILAAHCESLSGKLGIEKRFRDTGVGEDALEELAGLTLEDGALVYNPRPTFDQEEILEIYKKAW
ncbi:MAG: iron-containing alcohol dehydrogenase [Deltaproteobacteria bacterium]|nr:iron-containing alcohol dehydrogenase [Deltaproteobacteria bacterium]